ncbi:hypothetical protein D3C81_1890220 [compost metagenome]
MRPQILELDVSHRALNALRKCRQGLRYRCLAALGRCQRLGQCAFPARFDDLLADRTQRFTSAIEIGLGAIVFVIGQELRQIARTYQCVDRAVFAGQAL